MIIIWILLTSVLCFASFKSGQENELNKLPLILEEYLKVQERIKDKLQPGIEAAINLIRSRKDRI